MSKHANYATVRVEPSKSDPGNWYWAVLIDGEVYADGEEGDEASANLKATRNLDEWKEKQC